MSTIEMWDMPRIAAEFGVAPNTVQSTWRNASIKQVEKLLADAGYPEPTVVLGCEVKALTGLRWREVRLTWGLPVLRMPASALPLPDIMLGTKPGWREIKIRKWAIDTNRADDDGRLRRAAPPGRPVGIVETVPRRRRAEV